MWLKYNKYNLGRGLYKVKTRTAIALSAVTLAITGGTGLSLMSFGAAHAATNTVVSQSNPNGWAFFDDNGHGGAGSFVNGPGTPPLGSGSAQFDLTASDQGYGLGTSSYGGTALSSIDELSYSTYVQTGNNTEAPALQLNIDSDLTDGSSTWQGRLVYEPYHTQTVTDGTWQTWNTMDNSTSGGHGNWWFSNGTLATNSGCAQATPCTWEQVLAAEPNAGVNETYPGVVFKAGSGWVVPFTGNVDALSIGVNGSTDTYDFERAAPAQVTGMTISQNGNEIGCGVYVTDRTITVSWDASTNPYFDHYVYQADSDQMAPIDFTTSVNTNSRTGNIRDLDGTYSYRVAEVDTNGTQGSWSDWCSVTLDRVAPVVAITNPSDGDTVSGTVDVRGTVTDTNPDHYYLRITRNSDNHVVYSHVYYGGMQNFTDHSIYSWNTTGMHDGDYTILLAARDAAGNRDAGSEDSVVVTVNNMPSDKDQCKEDGWRFLHDEDGNMFRNQGQCVSWVNHHDGHGHDDDNYDRHHHRHH